MTGVGKAAYFAATPWEKTSRLPAADFEIHGIWRWMIALISLALIMIRMMATKSSCRFMEPILDGDILGVITGPTPPTYPLLHIVAHSLTDPEQALSTTHSIGFRNVTVMFFLSMTGVGNAPM